MKKNLEDASLYIPGGGNVRPGYYAICNMQHIKSNVWNICICMHMYAHACIYIHMQAYTYKY